MRIGITIFVGAILVSIGAAMYAYVQYAPNFVAVEAGEAVTVGPVQYTVLFDGIREGSEDAEPEHAFVGIKITAENLGDERTMLSGGQFFIVGGETKRTQPTYGEFSEKDLLLEWLEPGDHVERSTQFDIKYDESVRYDVIIRPQKDQSSSDVAKVCITNC